MKVFRTFGSNVPTGLSKLLSSVFMNFLWKNCWMKKKIDVFSRFFCGFLTSLAKIFLQGCHNKHCTCQQRHLGKDYFLRNNFHFRYRGKVSWGFSFRRFAACLQQLPSRHRGERFEEKLFVKWLYLLYLFETLSKIVFDP